MQKELLKLLHNFKLCPNLCNVKYPWSWRSKLTNKNLSYIKYSVCKNFKSDDNREFIHHLNFKENSAEAYKIIYNTYIENKDFLDFCYATPSLSNALNQLRNSSNISSLSKEINIKNINIIDSWFEFGLTKSNSKILGFYNKEEIIKKFN